MMAAKTDLLGFVAKGASSRATVHNMDTMGHIKGGHRISYWDYMMGPSRVLS